MSDRADYYANAASWADDSRAATARSRRIAWTVAGIAVAAAAFQAVALAMLLPLKTVQPVTLLVDRQTGYVQALDPTTSRRVSADAALTDAFLAQYVAAREGFDRATLQLDYRKVGLWSAGNARAGYFAGMAGTNPASPLQAYPAGTTVSVRIKSVSRLATGTALVRFDSAVQGRDGRVAPAQPWIAVVRFRYSDAAMSFADRLVNPLGFQVTSYRRDAEAPPVAVSPTSVVTVPAAAVVPVAPVQGTTARTGSPLISRRGARTSAPAQVGGPFREVPVNQLPMGSPLGPVAIVAVPPERAP